jgi:hypothetical protein
LEASARAYARALIKLAEMTGKIATGKYSGIR